MKLLTLGLIGAALISGVTATGLQAMFAIANSTVLFFDGNRTEGASYSENGQKLDIYTPERDGTGLKPVVVFFYGGSWQSGQRTSGYLR